VPKSHGARRCSRAHRRRHGFTIVELFVALAIVGILAAVAVPSLAQLVHRSRRAEAYTGLRGIHDAQTYYESLYRVYAESFAQLGFELDGGEILSDGSIRGRHYTFTLQPVPLDGDPRGNFRATAAGDIDGSDPVLDILVIENRLTVVAEAPGAADRTVDSNEAVLVSDDITNRTRAVASASDGAGAPGSGTGGSDSSGGSSTGGESGGSDAGRGSDRSRSGLGDDTNPGQGPGRENAPDAGGSNPSAGPRGEDGPGEARPARRGSDRRRPGDARPERARASRPGRRR